MVILFITAGMISLLAATLGVLIALKVQSSVLRSTGIEHEAWQHSQEAHKRRTRVNHSLCGEMRLLAEGSVRTNSTNFTEMVSQTFIRHGWNYVPFAKRNTTMPIPRILPHARVQYAASIVLKMQGTTLLRGATKSIGIIE